MQAQKVVTAFVSCSFGQSAADLQAELFGWNFHPLGPCCSLKRIIYYITAGTDGNIPKAFILTFNLSTEARVAVSMIACEPVLLSKVRAVGRSVERTLHGRTGTGWNRKYCT